MDTIFKKRSSALSGKPMKMKKPALDIALTIVNYFLLVFLVVVMLYPFWSILVKSFMSDRDIISYPYAFFPKNLQFDGYKTIFVNKTYNFGRAFVNSVFVTLVDTAYQLAITTMAAYALSKKTLPGRGIIFFYFIFTMYFGGGLIPTYLVIQRLQMLNTIWALILPGCLSVYNMIVARTFFKSNISEELYEAAEIDGCTQARFFFQIALPLSKAIIAILVLYYGVGHWNSYFSALVYISDKAKYPLQLVLRNILITNQTALSQTATTAAARAALQEKQQLIDVMKYSLIIISSIPVLVMYPLVQKHFVKGVMIGSMKG